MSNEKKKDDMKPDYKVYIANLFTEHNKGKPWGIEELEKHDKILYSTFGFHDVEPPHSIIKRKLEEVENNVVGLWGASTNTVMDKIVEFCNEIKAEGKDPYLLLKYTPSEEQTRANEAEQKKIEWNRIYTPEDLLKENCFKFCQTPDGEQYDLKSEKTHIFVKGSDKQQDKAFVVGDYFLVGEILANPEKLTHFFYSGFEGYQNTSRLKLNKEVDLSSMVGTNWGIALKLKAPYIVKCF